MNNQKSTRHRGASWCVLGSVIVAVGIAGCAAPRSLQPQTATPMTKNRLLGQQGGRHDLDQARAMIDVGDYSVVVPRLLHVIGKYPHSQAAVEARYWLGVTYNEIQSYRDAIDMFNEYLRLDPHGKYAEECAKYVARLNTEYEQKYWTAEKLEGAIKALTAKLSQNPNDLAAELELADVYWKRGDFEKAGQLYGKIIQAHPEYEKDATVVSRVERQLSGELLVLTPTEMARRLAENQPLVVVNQATFHGGRDLYTREARNYVVTGQALNRSQSVLYGVQVNITIYAFGNVVYDTSTVNIGRLNPGEARAFSVAFSNFDNIDNIYRVECIGTFQR